MSYDQQSSHQQPWLSEPGPEVKILSPADDAKSQRWRLILGCSSVFLGLASGFYAYTDISMVIRAMNTAATAGDYIPADAMNHAIAVIAVFCVLALAYVGVGIWNIITRRSTAKSPLIAAIILAAAALILIVIYMTTQSTGLRVGGIGLNVLIISRAAIVLRMKKVPVYPTAAEWTN
ncbi:hypothetical protein J7I84_16635 [Arthrobacter sp. ISL-85]|uniref:hypothetical protein n=1 Tax=Arthrobacter sp. ISL-85 TaxID=2819115 RepID=UPI001BE53559|nr:hypothetical protein [Arthrobacter sp. ISL-85]MBT2568094.1 hypothetical protein [Arthrobacter sp. ISL-85]